MVPKSAESDGSVTANDEPEAAMVDSNGRFSSGDPIRHGKTANYLFVDGHILPTMQERAENVLLGLESL